MELITKRGIIRGVAASWRQQYGSENSGVLARLRALDTDTATEEDVRAIIGNDGWTRLECDECGQSVDVAVSVGEAPDYESRSAIICSACLSKALTMAEAQQ